MTGLLILCAALVMMALAFVWALDRWHVAEQRVEQLKATRTDADARELAEYWRLESSAEHNLRRKAEKLASDRWLLVQSLRQEFNDQRAAYERAEVFWGTPGLRVIDGGKGRLS